MGILAGDIGGTKTHLAVFDDSDLRKKIFEKKYASASHADFLSIVRDFLSSFPSKEGTLKKACFGVAGPVQGGKCKTTNLPWIIDAGEVEKATSLSSVVLLNDLEANAYGIPLLREEELFILHEGTKKIGNCALIAAGTGLGEAGMVWDGMRHIPFACEGGHADFAPRDELEMELLRYLIEQSGHVSYERVISGPGIYQLYRFLVDMHLEEEDPEVRNAFSISDPPKVITQLALEQKDRLAERAVDWFISLYGAEAGNLALKFLAFGGVYLGGGLAPRLASLLRNGDFMSSFINKGRFAGLLNEIPVRIILNNETALLGAAAYVAERVVEENRQDH